MCGWGKEWTLNTLARDYVTEGLSRLWLECRVSGCSSGSWTHIVVEFCN